MRRLILFSGGGFFVFWEARMALTVIAAAQLRVEDGRSFDSDPVDTGGMVNEYQGQS
jgi:hypothetical protein